MTKSILLLPSPNNPGSSQPPDQGLCRLTRCAMRQSPSSTIAMCNAQATKFSKPTQSVKKRETGAPAKPPKRLTFLAFRYHLEPRLPRDPYSLGARRAVESRIYSTSTCSLSSTLASSSSPVPLLHQSYNPGHPNHPT